MRILVSLAAAVLIVLLGHSTFAAERQATSLELRTTIDPPGTWRVMGSDRATSDCIGDPVTPTCAVETQFACFVRRVVQLCFLSDQTSDARVYNFPKSPPPEDGDIYRIDKIRRVTRLSPTERSFLETNGDKLPDLTRVGDVLIHAKLDECAKSPKGCDGKPLNGFSCFARQTGLRWKLLSCFGDGLGENE